MAIKNPYPLEEHCVFKRTFLQQTEVITKFTPAIKDVDFRDRMQSFLKSVFNLEPLELADSEASHVEIRSEDVQIKFVFDLDQAKFIIGPKGYKTFAETAIPLIGILNRFACEVAKIDSIAELNIVKINGWQINAEDSFSDFPNIIRYTFNESCVSDMLSYKFDENPKPIKLSKTSNNAISEEINLDAILSAEVASKEIVKLGLALNASTKNVNTNDLLSDSIILNDTIYRGFIETVSENILNLMSRENLS
ncbi:MAG: hypothetical protein PUC21_02870 [Bacteroidales bacterium]|nr:hypothetical protein [Bacteroidales bacterium]